MKFKGEGREGKGSGAEQRDKMRSDINVNGSLICKDYMQ